MKAATAINIAFVFFCVYFHRKSLVVAIFNLSVYKILMKSIDCRHCYKHGVVIYMAAIALTMTERFLLIIILHGSSSASLPLFDDHGMFKIVSKLNFISTSINVITATLRVIFSMGIDEILYLINLIFCI